MDTIQKQIANKAAFGDAPGLGVVPQESRASSQRGEDLFVFSSPDCRHLDKEISSSFFFLKGPIASLVAGQIFSASQTALPISWLAGIQLQLEHTQVKGCLSEPRNKGREGKQ